MSHRNVIKSFLVIFALFLNTQVLANNFPTFSDYCLDNPNGTIGNFECNGNVSTQSEAHSVCVSFLSSGDGDEYMQCMSSFLPFAGTEETLKGCNIRTDLQVFWGVRETETSGDISFGCIDTIPADEYAHDQSFSVSSDRDINGDTYIGTADFVCQNGVFRIDPATSVCNRMANSCEIASKPYTWDVTHIGDYRFDRSTNTFYTEVDSGGGIVRGVEISIDNTDFKDKRAQVISLLNATQCQSIVPSNTADLSMYEHEIIKPNNPFGVYDISSGFNFTNFVLNDSAESVYSPSYMVDFCYDGSLSYDGSPDGNFSRERYEQYNSARIGAGLITPSQRDRLEYQKCTTFPVDCQTSTLNVAAEAPSSSYGTAPSGTCTFDTEALKHGNDPLRVTVSPNLGTSANFLPQSNSSFSQFGTMTSSNSHGYGRVQCFNGAVEWNQEPVCHLNPVCRQEVSEVQTDQERVVASTTNYGTYGNEPSKADLIAYFGAELQSKCTNLGFRGEAVLDNSSILIEDVVLSEFTTASQYYWKEGNGSPSTTRESYGVSDNSYREIEINTTSLVVRNRANTILQNETCNNANVGLVVNGHVGAPQSCTSDCDHILTSYVCVAEDNIQSNPTTYADSITVSASCSYVVDPQFTDQDLCEVGVIEGGFDLNAANKSNDPYFRNSYYTWSCGNGLMTGAKAESCTGLDANIGENIATCGAAQDNNYGSLSSSNSNLCGSGSSLISGTFETNQDSYDWSCQNGNGTTSCSAYRNPVCGSNNGGTYQDLRFNNANNCNIGSNTNFEVNSNTFDWECVNGGQTVSCSASRVSACGSNSGATFTNLNSGSSGNCGVGSTVINFSTNQDTFTWNCRNGSNTTSQCSAYRSATCGTNENGTFANLTEMPSGANCGIGSVNNPEHSSDFPPQYNGQKIDWNCANGSSNQYCDAFRNPTCGSSAGNNFNYNSAPTSGLCGIGSVSQSVARVGSEFVWKCANGVSSHPTFPRREVTCKAFVNPICEVPPTGSTYNPDNAEGNIFTTTSSKCEYGSVQGGAIASNRNNWTWSCESGSNAVSCLSYKSPKCGSNNGSVFSPTGLASGNSANCDRGTISNFSSSSDTTYTWRCNNGSETVNCEAYKQVSCGTSHLRNFSTAPTSNLCNNNSNSPNPVLVNGGNNYSWTCSNSGTGNSVNCSAYRNPVCGSPSPSASAPTSGLCSVGSPTSGATTSSGSPNWNWTCRNGSSANDISCSSIRIATCNNSTFDGCNGGATSVNGTGVNATNPTYNWYCRLGGNSSTTSSMCSRNKTGGASGVCGTSSQSEINTRPSASCSTPYGATAVSGSATSTPWQWNWRCYGQPATSTSLRGSDSPTCYTGKLRPQCDNSSVNSCTYGSLSDISDSSTEYRWNCTLNGFTTSPNCSRLRPSACGSADNNTTPTAVAPSSNLCSVGSASSVSGSGSNWVWSCKNGSMPAVSCDAPKDNTPPQCNNSSVNSCSVGSFVDRADTSTRYIWECRKTGFSADSCSKDKPSTCGSADNNTTPTAIAPSSNLCGTGNASSVSGSGSNWVWSCKNGSSASVSCNAPRDTTGPSCGSSYDSCSVGTFQNGTDTSTQIRWSCAKSGFATVSCAKDRASSCGSADNNTTPTVTAPSSGLCSVGSSSSVSSSGSNWVWSCTNGTSASVSCNAPRDTSAPSCGSSYDSCSIGTFQNGTDTSTQIRWSCTKSGFTSASCSKDRASSCGSADNNTTPTVTAPSSNLCSVGSASSVSSSGSNWVWSCKNGSSASISCDAPRDTSAPSCGSNYNTCSVGSFQDRTDTSTTSRWSCTKSGFTSASCEKAKTAGINGRCGSANNTTSNLTSAPSGSAACEEGSREGLSGNIDGAPQWSWICSGSDETSTRRAGSDDYCSGGEPVAATPPFGLGQIYVCSGGFGCSAAQPQYISLMFNTGILNYPSSEYTFSMSSVSQFGCRVESYNSGRYKRLDILGQDQFSDCFITVPVAITHNPTGQIRSANVHVSVSSGAVIER